MIVIHEFITVNSGVILRIKRMKPPSVLPQFVREFEAIKVAVNYVTTHNRSRASYCVAGITG
jgi:hypothetical protein